MQKVKNILKKSARRFLLARGYSINRVGNIDFLESLLRIYLKQNGDLFFIQIGANDGKSFDPIYEFVKSNHQKVRGIVVEPLKDYFEELKVNYKKCPNVIPVNVAIHNTEKMMPLYRVDPKKLNDLPDWYKGTVSFNLDHFKLSSTPMDIIIKEVVECIPLDKLLEEYQVSKMDLLLIDAEGYDSEIITNIDFNLFKPMIIHFEHGLSAGVMSKERFFKVMDTLHNNGYELWIDFNDATAYQWDIIVDQ